MPGRLAVLGVVLSACVPIPIAETSPPPPPTVIRPASGDDATVIEVLDGDSLILRIGGERTEVRLAAINAPERDECQGPEARMHLSELVTSGPLSVTAFDTDQFGRTLAEVFAGKLSVTEEMVASGHALALTSNSTTSDRLIDLEEQAATAGAGIWSSDVCGAGPVPDVTITDLEPNPPGRDEDDLDGEWVEIRAHEDVDLSGWILRDESSTHRFVFPPDTTMVGGQSLRVVTGCKPRSGGLAWCSDVPVWNNGGDSALLQQPEGRVVDRRRYRDSR